MDNKIRNNWKRNPYLDTVASSAVIAAGVFSIMLSATAASWESTPTTAATVEVCRIVHLPLSDLTAPRFAGLL